MSRSVLLVVLPHLPKPQVMDPHRKANRTYLAFPYGVLTIASYLRRHAKNLGAVEVLDLNLPGNEDAEAVLAGALGRASPDIVGFSLNYDISYGWLKMLVGVTRAARPGATLVAGGSAVTTAYGEIIADCDLDACCYSEGELGMLNLVDSNEIEHALTQDPWVTRARPRSGTLYGDLDEIVNVDYSLVDVPAYSMREAFSPFTRFETSSRQFFIVTSRGCPFKCISGDTPVNTIYGNIPIAELAERGDDVPVYTYDRETGGSKVATARNIRFTGKSRLVRVAFDDGSYIDVTPDHKFQAFKWGNQFVDGSEWLSEARELEKGTHIRAIKFPPAIANPYPQACWGSRSKAIHLMVAEWKLGRPLAEGERVHHKNNDKGDWSPDNLVICSGQREHFDEHHPEIAERMRVNNPTKNGVSQEWRDNLSKALTGVKKPEASRENYRQGAIKREAAKREQRAERVNHKVVSVKELGGLHDTYCLEVPETGWFYANNVLVKNCVFCAEPSFHGANMRYVSVDKVVEHVAMLKDRYGLSVLTIYDDQILMAKDRAKELFRRLAALDIRVEMPNGVTLSYIDAEMAELMAAAGVDTIFLAIEHGSQRVLKDIIKKPIAFKRIKPTVALLQAAGIYCQGFFVIGLPGETRAERQETRDAVVDWGLDWASFNYATPLRGSELFRMCREKGWIAPEHLPIGAIDMTEYVIRAPGMDKAEIEDFVFSTNLDVNFVNNRNMRVGRYEVARDAFAELITRHPGQPFAHYYLAECQARLGGHGGASRERYREIIAGSPTWRAAAERFRLEVGDGEAGRPHPGRVRDSELRAHQGV